MYKSLLFFLLLLLLQCDSGLAQELVPKRPIFYTDTTSQEAWVDQLMQTMSVREKIGQLMMVSSYSNKDQTHELQILDLIENQKIGGLIFMQGTPFKQVVLTNKFQARSKIPLLIGFDGEWGLNMRLDSTYKYPWNLALGAVQDTALIHQLGKRIGAQCQRMGIHINFAPVVDINTNPSNPIIGNRSYGADRKIVSDRALAFTQGLQSQKVLACAKHFPGHGETSEDSHKTLPLVTLDSMRIDSVELYPYKQLIKNGLASIMTAHLQVPSLDTSPNLPTSLSPAVVTGLLKNTLDFEGLVITDALNMKGAANFAEPGSLELSAFLAGNDILLFPEQVPVAIDYMLKAYHDNRYSITQLDAAVRRILMAKYAVGLANFQPISTENLASDLQNLSDDLLMRKLVDQSISVVKNKGIFPIKDLTQKIGYLKLGKDTGMPFYNMLRQYAPINELSLSNLTALKNYDLIIIGLHKSNANPWKSYEMTDAERAVILQLSKEHQVILSVFTSPYTLRKLPDLKDIESIVISFQNSDTAQEITAQKIFGALATHGKIPVSPHPSIPVGTGYDIQSMSRLSYGLPEEVQMNHLKLEKIDSIAATIISEEMAPGLQILVARHGKVVYQKSFGYFTYDKKVKVQNTNLYDLASITKILGALPMLMEAQEEGRYQLDQSIASIIPEAIHSNKETVTIRQAMSHVGRLKAWIPYYLSTLDSVTKKPMTTYYRSYPRGIFTTKVAEKMYIRSDYQDSIFEKIIQTDLREKNGYRYSDLFFTLSKKYIESTYHKPLEFLVDSLFYKPLGAYTLTYNPLNKFPKNRIVPTEKDTYFRNQTLQGNVHDMAAAMMGGVSGHAGLFGSANDVAKMMQMYLQKGFYGGKRYFKPTTLETFNYSYYAHNEVRRGLGFDKPQINPEEKATCGCVSPKSFGHSGFTGTYTWADPESGLLYVFLSNRVYPTMENKKLIMQNIRTEIQGVVQGALVD